MTQITPAYLHNTIPIIASRHPKQRQESHSEVAEVRVFAQTNARVALGTFYSPAALKFHVQQTDFITRTT